VSFIAHCESFHSSEARRKDRVPSFLLSLSAFAVNFLFFGRLKGASMAMSLGLHSRILPMISLSLKRWRAEITLPFNVAHPVGFSGVAAGSTPAIMGACVFNVCSCVEYQSVSLLALCFFVEVLNYIDLFI